jgi:hypothetical protein
MEDKKKGPGNEMPKFSAITAIFILTATQRWDHWPLAFVLWLCVLAYALWQDKKWIFKEKEADFSGAEYHQ